MFISCSFYLFICQLYKNSVYKFLTIICIAQMNETLKEKIKQQILKIIRKAKLQLLNVVDKILTQ